MSRLQTIPNLLSTASSSSSSSSSPSTLLKKPIFIRPSSFPQTSFYAITRSKLKFTSIKQVNQKSTSVNPDKIVGGGRDGSGKSNGADENQADLIEGGNEKGSEIRVTGRAWGRLYWEGKPVPNPSPLSSSKIDTLIHGGSKPKWVIVDQNTIPESVISDLQKARESSNM